MKICNTGCHTLLAANKNPNFEWTIITGHALTWWVLLPSFYSFYSAFSFFSFFLFFSIFSFSFFFSFLFFHFLFFFPSLFLKDKVVRCSFFSVRAGKTTSPAQGTCPGRTWVSFHFLRPLRYWCSEYHAWNNQIKQKTATFLPLHHQNTTQNRRKW